MMEDNIDSRMKRVQAAIALESSDRTPVSLMLGYKFPCRYKGITQGAYFRDRSSADEAFEEVFNELGGWDIVAAAAYTTRDRNLVEAPMKIRVPGRDLREDEVMQYDEAEVLTHDDYDRIIKVGWKTFMDGFYPEFRGWDVDQYHDRIEARVEPEQAAIKKGIELWHDRGYPVFNGATVFTPLMMLSSSRTMMKFAMDIHRIPDKVEAVMDAMIDDLIDIAVRISKESGITGPFGLPSVLLVLERGGCFYFPLKVFEKFELPYLKKMVEALVAQGITPILHFDQDWTLNMPYLKELPAKKCFMQLDSTTDIFKTKEILKDHMCIMGDMPPSLLTLGTPEEVEAYCKKLIDVVGEGGGFILGVG